MLGLYRETECVCVCVYFVRIKRSNVRDWRIQLRMLASPKCAVRQAGGSGDLIVEMKSEGSLLENSFFVGEAGLFALFTPSTDGLPALLSD